MSKKIVIDKEDWEKIAQEFNSNDLPKVTEIDTDQSIVDRAERYSHLINKNDEMREFFAYKAGATEQDLISKAREKIYDVDFSGNVMSRIKVKGNEIKITDAMNGYGNAIDIEKIKIKEVTI